jgi:micrococcal nuclease
MMSIKDKLYHYKGKVGRVIDGDTFYMAEIDLGFDITLKNKKVRLLGINTMELKDFDSKKRKLAYEAKDYMIKRLEGKDVVIKSVGFDDFGRILALVWLEEELINDTLLKNGLAVVFEK